MIYGLKCAALWNCITKECWLGHFKEEINNQRISDSPRQRKTERVKDKSADARPRQDCWVRQIVSLIAVCWDCNRDKLNIWFRKWDVHVFASSYLISFYHFIIPKLSRGKLQHTLFWLESWNQEDPVNVCLPLPHASVYVLRFAISNQANCHKTGEQHINLVCLHVLYEGWFSQPNNNNASQWTQSPLTDTNQKFSVFIRSGHSFPKVSFCWISLNCTFS